MTSLKQNELYQVLETGALIETFEYSLRLILKEENESRYSVFLRYFCDHKNKLRFSLCEFEEGVVKEPFKGFLSIYDLKVLCQKVK